VTSTSSPGQAEARLLPLCWRCAGQPRPSRSKAMDDALRVGPSIPAGGLDEDAGARNLASELSQRPDRRLEGSKLGVRVGERVAIEARRSTAPEAKASASGLRRAVQPASHYRRQVSERRATYLAQCKPSRSESSAIVQPSSPVGWVDELVDDDDDDDESADACDPVRSSGRGLGRDMALPNSRPEVRSC
jgi:hypothetical protein